MTKSPNGPLRVGIGGPVGSGKTALMEALCKAFRDRYDICAITNDIYTKEDALILTRAGALPVERIMGVETGGCPHTAIREDASINLAAVAEMGAKFPGLDVILIESGGDNLAATFSPELADLTIYVIDVAQGEKIPRKGGPGITRSDLLVINKTDLAPHVGASLEVMESDTRRMRGERPFVFTNLKTGDGAATVAAFVERAGGSGPDAATLNALRRHFSEDMAQEIVSVIPGMFFARDGARPADVSEPAPAETEAATSPEVLSFPAIHQINKAQALAVRWWNSRSSIAMMIEDTGEVCVGADTFAFKSWRPTKHWLLRPDGPGKDLEIRLSDIESVRLDRIRFRVRCTWFLCVILQYRTADGGSDEVWLTGSGSRIRIPKLHAAIAARLAARGRP